MSDQRPTFADIGYRHGNRGLCPVWDLSLWDIWSSEWGAECQQAYSYAYWDGLRDAVNALAKTLRRAKRRSYYQSSKQSRHRRLDCLERLMEKNRE